MQRRKGAWGWLTLWTGVPVHAPYVSRRRDSGIVLAALVGAMFLITHATR